LLPLTSGFITGSFLMKFKVLLTKNFELLKQNPRHPSLRLKKIGVIYTVRVGLHYRAIAKDRPEGLVWFWIGHHSVYDSLIQ
jgi:hypothetical protein